MSVIKAIKFMFSSKGIFPACRRIYTVCRRFSFTPLRQLKYIRRYIEILESLGAKATFFIPAAVLERYHLHLGALQSHAVEWGIHGYRHIDLSIINAEQLKSQIVNATGIFDKYKIKFHGFRAPYLKNNDKLPGELARTQRFLYDSSKAVFVGNSFNPGLRNLKWISNFYGPAGFSKETALPKFKNGLWEVPVILPDDEILLDRVRLPAGEILLVWKNILRVCQENKSPFIMQLHPERILDLASVLTEFIDYARNTYPKVSFITLSDLIRQLGPGEIKDLSWAVCITGDIDSLSLRDFLLR